MKRLIALLALATAMVAWPGGASAAVGDQVLQITPPVSGAATFCSVGLAFDGTSLYYDRCGDGNIYRIHPTTAALLETIPSGIPENPNAMAFDATRNGLWIGTQGCNSTGMPIYFMDLVTKVATLQFTIPFSLVNPATGESFISFCFDDGLAFNANDALDPTDDEIWFSDDINRNLGVFRPDGTLVAGHDASTIDGSLNTLSGVAIGGQNLYLANDGGGDVFRADKDTLALVDQFTSGDDRQEDMECDPVTFAPIEVMWVRTTPQGDPSKDLITAYEIEPATCALGGGGEEPPEVHGFMTGGGSVFTSTGVRVTHGFHLQCTPADGTNSLQVNWGKGNRFHLTSVTSASCSDDPAISPEPPAASFDTHRGSGTGKYNGVPGATAEWTITDAGEPGTSDTMTLTIKDAANNVVLTVSGPLNHGNHQAHDAE